MSVKIFFFFGDHLNLDRIKVSIKIVSFAFSLQNSHPPIQMPGYATVLDHTDITYTNVYYVIFKTPLAVGESFKYDAIDILVYNFI